MKTRERIIVTSLALFNQFGEPNVTTLQIADEMDISPGNLYYHYKNKTEILNELFNRYESQMMELLDVPEVEISLEDQWLFLHLVFEKIAEFRFLYQDLVNVLSKHPKIANRFKRILDKKLTASITILSSLQQQRLLDATDQEIKATCHSIVLTITYWISYEMVSRGADGDAIDLGKGVFQVMSLMVPYLRNDARTHFQEMSTTYL